MLGFSQDGRDSWEISECLLPLCAADHLRLLHKIKQLRIFLFQWLIFSFFLPAVFHPSLNADMKKIGWQIWLHHCYSNLNKWSSPQWSTPRITFHKPWNSLMLKLVLNGMKCIRRSGLKKPLQSHLHKLKCSRLPQSQRGIHKHEGDATVNISGDADWAQAVPLCCLLSSCLKHNAKYMFAVIHLYLREQICGMRCVFPLFLKKSQWKQHFFFYEKIKKKEKKNRHTHNNLHRDCKVHQNVHARIHISSPRLLNGMW